jgi:hypothetical protein
MKKWRLKFVSTDGKQCRRRVVSSPGGDHLRGEIEEAAMLYEMQYGGTWICDEVAEIEN